MDQKTSSLLGQLHAGDARALARAISLVEDRDSVAMDILAGLNRERIERALILGLTGPPGAGKSTLTGQLITALRRQDIRVGIIAVDPSSPISGGSLLGDRIRMMQHSLDKDVVVRSMATRGRLGGLCTAAGAAVRIMAASGCRVILLETVGIGQSEMDIVRLADITTMVLAPGFGDDIQAMKAGILEVADLIVVNKADLPGAQKLLHDMATVFDGLKQRENRVFATTAKEGRGIEELLDQLFALEDSFRQSESLQKRRQRAFDLETLDWVTELLKEKLGSQMGDIQIDHLDPRLAADRLIKTLCSDEKR